MSSGLSRAIPEHQRPGGATLLGVSLVITAVWMQAGALLCTATFAMSLQPPENPADAAPFPGTLWYPVLLLAGLLSLALAPSPVVVLMTGLTYLRRVTLTSWHWQTALAGAAAAGVATEALLLRASSLPSGTPPGLR